ncbi:mobile element protein [Aquipluma nitroreducens]|uniref:Mobile element protein n=2 Tax=Aquipluma nitroreducens TaxID=2010828 RepID=A0A5K7S4B5_9BACT|nr:mobile element protein [Aquipluma nitroreducens]
MLLSRILKDNRKRKHSLRDIFNAIFYLLKTGCQLDTPEQISSVRRNKLTTFRRSKWLGFAGAN